MINLKANYPSLSIERDLFKDFTQRISLKNILDLPSGFLNEKEQSFVYAYLNCPSEHATNSVLHCKSGSQAIYSILLALKKQSILTGVEEFTYSGFKWAADELNYKLISIECDEEGIKPASLQKAIEQGVRMIYLQPTIQNPTCFVMGKERRREIADIIRKNDVFLFEDDAYRFLHPDPPPSFLELLPDKTIHIFSLSKPFNSFIESCYVFYPERIVPKLDDYVRLTGGFGSTLSKEFSIYLFKKNRLLNLINRKQKKAIEVKHKLRKVLHDFDQCSYPSSFHLWVRLHGKKNSFEITEALQQENIQINGSHEYSVRGNDQFIRIALSGEKDISTLKSALKKVTELSSSLTV